MERIEQAAETSVARAVSFGALAISMTMLGLAYDAVLAFRFGAGGCLLMAAVLWLKAQMAPRRSYRKTEVWLILDRRLPLPDDRAQAVIGGVLHAIFRRYATYAACAAVFLWILSLLARLSALG